MTNPWTEVSLEDYESHMALSEVYQLQTLDAIMHSQFSTYKIESVAILGVAGGNGLGNLEQLPDIKNIYGVDINAGYLRASEERYPALRGRYSTLLADINADCSLLPRVDMVIANLFIEYVGCRNFAAAVGAMAPKYVSCVIQIDTADTFVSDSPYAARLGVLDSVHSAVDSEELAAQLVLKGYKPAGIASTKLPNGKYFRRLDFERIEAEV